MLRACIQHQSSVEGLLWRVCFSAPRFFLALTRRFCDVRVGLVAFLAFGGGFKPSCKRSAKRAIANCLFWYWERSSDTTIFRQPLAHLFLSSSSNLCLWKGPNTEERFISKTSSTRLSVLFTPCPPGPEDLEKRHFSSLEGITKRELIVKSLH